MSYFTGTGILLAKQSLAILKQKKSLIIFPLLSTIVILAVFIAGLTSLFKIEATAWVNPKAVSKATVIIFYLIFLALFFVVHLLTILFNAGLITCTTKQITGEPYTISSGFKTVCFRFPMLYLWASLMTTFGGFVRIAEYWSDRWPASKMATDLLAGLPWLMATLLMTPIVAIEKINPWRAIKRSAHLFKNTWGTSVVSNIGIEKITLPLRVISFIPLIIAMIIGSKTLLIVCGIITAILFFSISTAALALQSTLISALYLYANGIDVASFYDVELLKNAFCPTKKDF